MTKNKSNFWLIKSRRDCYSIEQFARDKKTLWSGIRNYQARNTMMTEMKPGDQFLFYHSNIKHPEIVGVGRITKTNLPDLSAQDRKNPQFDPKATPDRPVWYCAEIVYEGHLIRPVSLEKIKDLKNLANMDLLTKGKRLSILPVRKVEFDLIIKRSGGLMWPLDEESFSCISAGDELERNNHGNFSKSKIS